MPKHPQKIFVGDLSTDFLDCTAEAWWVALLRDHFEVFLKKYICKMNDWHWSDFHFNFERSFLCWSENLSNIHCASFFSACHVMKRDFSLKYKMDANFDKVKFPANLGIFGREGSSACARCHGRLGLSGDPNHIGTGMWWEELKPIWATNRSYQRDGKRNSKFDKSGLCP